MEERHPKTVKEALEAILSTMTEGEKEQIGESKKVRMAAQRNILLMSAVPEGIFGQLPDAFK